MQPITIEVPAEYIGVLKLFAAKDDAHYNLNCIALEVGRSESRLVATDGFKLGVFRIVSEQPTVTEPFTVIIPNSLVEYIKPFKGPVGIQLHMDGLGISLHQAGMLSHGQPIDDTYPNWRQIMPKGKISGQVAQFNPGFIGNLGKAAALLHGRAWMDKAGTIAHNGESAAIIDLQWPNFTGVIMPWKATPPDKMPAWVFDDLQVQDKAASAAPQNARLYAWPNRPKGG